MAWNVYCLPETAVGARANDDVLRSLYHRQEEQMKTDNSDVVDSELMVLCPDAVDTPLPGVDTISTVVDPDATDGVVAVDSEIGTDAPDVPVDVGRKDCGLCPDAVDPLLPALDHNFRWCRSGGFRNWN